MGARLLIGDIAKLLGVTPKTIRHYHRVGLLGDPERTASGYRVYGTQDLLRLQRIKRLQALGLSLKQVRAVLGGPDREQSLRMVLERLHRETNAEIEALQERQARIERLLADRSLRVLQHPDEMPPTLKMAKEQLAEHLLGVDSAIWELEERLFAQLDTFLWPNASYRAHQQELVHFIASHPEDYRQILALTERIAALAHVPENSPEVEQLAKEFVRLRQSNAILHKIASPEMAVHGPQFEALGEVLAGEMAATFSPAQARFFKLTSELSSAGD